MTYYQVMGFFDRVKSFLVPITDEQLRKVFHQDDLEVVAIYDVLVLSHILRNPRGYLVLLASGEGGFFHLRGEKLSVYADEGLPYRWRKGWGLIENPTKLETDYYLTSLPSFFKRDPKTKKLVFKGFSDREQLLEMDDAWSFWQFKFWKNTNSPNGATEDRVGVAINGKGINLETLLKRIPI